jgi:ApaG protein
MVGTYQVETDGGERFNIAIPAFSLDLPDTPRTIN